jgi:hypothetical protein
VPTSDRASEDPRLADARRLLDAADKAARAGDTLTDRIATTGAEQLLAEICADRKH